jgi:hypothetical protein
MDSDIRSHHACKSYAPVCSGSLDFSLDISQLSAQECRCHAPSHVAFEALDNPNQDLARFVELRIFPECDQVLVP